MTTARPGQRGIVLDASAVVPWFVTEQQTPAAEQLLLASRPLLAPRFVLLEVASAVLTQTRRGAVPKGRAVTAWETLDRMAAGNTSPGLTLFEDAPLFGRSLDLSEQTGHALYDCIYLVLAMREDAALATFDRRLAGVARRLSISLWAAEDPTR